ncbi:hypothetical protein GGF46_002961 [Coemansia sp. RSA 552]|nr:hypothetical protein GGF46_002961 [Coemansia sp. RSA 552]
MLVCAACRLLNSDVVDYGRLFNLIQFRLDDPVKGDYTVVVLFAANARYKPRAMWLYTAYCRLGCKYRFLYTMSSVEEVKTLSELVQATLIRNITIPPDIYQHDAADKVEIKATGGCTGLSVRRL